MALAGRRDDETLIHRANRSRYPQPWPTLARHSVVPLEVSASGHAWPLAEQRAHLCLAFEHLSIVAL